MKKLVILGGRGVGMWAASIAEDTGEYSVLGFLNDVVPVGDTVGVYQKYEVIGTSYDIDKYLKDKDTYFFIGYFGLKNEKSVFEKIIGLNIPNERLATLIHPTAYVPRKFCKIGSGVLIAPFARVCPDSTIEDNCILMSSSIIGHDSTMKRFSHIAADSIVGGNVTVGYGSHIGTNATIRENVIIGDFALIGSGSVVLKDVESNTIVAGNPARLLKNKE
jgi:acetyltransferase EpsM